MTTYTIACRVDANTYPDDDYPGCDGACDQRFPACMLDEDGVCQACVQHAAALAAAEEVRDSIQSEHDEAESEADSAESDLADALAAVRDARQRLAGARREMAKLAKRLSAAEAAVEALNA